MYILFIQKGNCPQWEFKVNSAQLQQKPGIPKPFAETEVPQAVLEH
jgi:hypothetical protein